MRYILFIIVVVLLCHNNARAVDVIQPDEVALVVNINDSTDTDSNSVFDWQQIINKYAEIHPLWDTSNVIRVRTLTFKHRSEYMDPYQSTCQPFKFYNRLPWAYFHHDIDTLADTTLRVTGMIDPGHNLPSDSSQDYVLSKIAGWFDDNDKWGEVKVLTFVMGMPHAMMPTAYYPCPYLNDDCGPGNIVNHSLDEAVMYYLHPGVADTFWKYDARAELRRPFFARNGIEALNTLYMAFASSDSGFTFVPGQKETINGFPFYHQEIDWEQDTLPVWVMTCRLDGINVADVLGSIERAAWPATRYNPQADSVEFEAGAIIDGTEEVDNTSFIAGNPWADLPGFRSNVINTFGLSNVFYDTVGGASNAVPYGINYELGCNGEPIPETPVIYYFSAGTHNCSNSCSGKLRPSNMNYWINGTLEFEVANGALTTPPESFSALVIRDTIFCTESSTCNRDTFCWTAIGGGAGRISGAIQRGFSYALGFSTEPSNGIFDRAYAVKAMGIKNHQFIKLAQVAKYYSCWVHICLGDPLGTWLDTIRPPAPVSASVSFHNVIACLHDSVSISFTTPHIDDMDSAFVFVYTSTPFSNVTHNEVAVKVGPDEAIIHNERYTTQTIDSVVVLLLDRVGNPSRQVYTPELFDYSEPPGTTDADRVLLVVNQNDTDDTDSNGKPDWRDIVLQYAITHPTWDTTNVCSVKTLASDGNLYHPQSIYSYRLHYDVDTSHVWDEYPTIQLPGGDHYILQRIGAWFDADCENRWGTIKYVALVKGMPLKTRNNITNWTGNPYTSPDSGTICKSVDEAIATFLRPNVQFNGYFKDKLNGAWTNGWKEKEEAESDSVWEFIPGTIYNKWPEYSTTKTDSQLQWVLVTRLDGNHVDDVRGMITRAAQPAWKYDASNDTYDMDHWAVVDNSLSVDSLRTPWTEVDSKSTLFYNHTVQTFSLGQILRDSTNGVSGGDPDSLRNRFGWSGSRNIPAGDSVLFYFSAATRHYPYFPKDMFYHLEFDLAPGALAITPELYDGWTVRDTSFRQGIENTTLLIESIANGFTYTIGSVHNPTRAKIPRPYNLPKAMGMPGCTFAMAAQMSHNGMGYQTLALGDPIGIWKDMTKPGEFVDAECGFFRLVDCRVDSLALVFTTPDDGDLDSVLVIAYSSSYSGLEVDTLVYESTGLNELYEFHEHANTGYSIDSVRVTVTDYTGNMTTDLYEPARVTGTIEVPVLNVTNGQDYWITALDSTWAGARLAVGGNDGSLTNTYAGAKVYTKSNGDYAVARVYVVSDTVNVGNISAAFDSLPAGSSDCPCVFDSVNFIVVVDRSAAYEDTANTGALCWIPKFGLSPQLYDLDNFDLWWKTTGYNDSIAADTIALSDFDQYAVDDSAHMRRLIFTTVTDTGKFWNMFEASPSSPISLHSSLLTRSDARNINPMLGSSQTTESISILTDEHPSATPPTWIIYYSWKPAWE